MPPIRAALRALCLSGIVTSLVFQANAVSSAVATTTTTTIGVPASGKPDTLDANNNNNQNPPSSESFIGRPVKRFVGSLARQGSLPSYHGKRIESSANGNGGDRNRNHLQNRDQLEEGASSSSGYDTIGDDLDAVKRFLGSLARQGGLPSRRSENADDNMYDDNDNQQDEEQGVLDDEDDQMLMKEQEEKRHLGSVARDGDLLHFASSGNKGRRFSSGFAHEGNMKRHLGTIARAGQQFHHSSGGRGGVIAGKRFVGALARTGDLPYRFKRSALDDNPPFPRLMAFDNNDGDDRYDYDRQDSAGGDDDDQQQQLQQEQQLFFPVKRHIGSVARLGWLPYVRNQRRLSSEQASVAASLPDRSFVGGRPTTSLSARLRLLNWLKQEEMAKARLMQQNGEEADKRNIASLVRAGDLSSRYRASRSASAPMEFVQLRERNGPPFARMLQFRGSSSSDAGSMRSPHAFTSSLVQSDGWASRAKRSIASVARQGHLPSHSSSSSSSGSSCSGALCGAQAERDEAAAAEVEKRHLGSLARSQLLPVMPRGGSGGDKRDSNDNGWSDDEELMSSREMMMNDDSDEIALPYPEIVF